MNLVKLHPTIYIIYYVLWLVFLFLFNNPFYIIASYIAIFALIYLQGIRSEFKNTIKMATKHYLNNKLFSYLSFSTICKS